MLLNLIPILLTGYLRVSPWIVLAYGAVVLLALFVAALRRGGSAFLFKTLMLFALCWAGFRAVLPEVAEPYLRFLVENLAEYTYYLHEAALILVGYSLHFFLGLLFFIVLLIFRRLFRLSTGVLFMVAMLPQFMGVIESSHRKMVDATVREQAEIRSVFVAGENAAIHRSRLS